MDIDVRDVGPAPLIAALGRELGIVQAINETVQWDEKQCFIDPGTHALAMVIDILLGRSPLYLVEKHYAEMDVELIFGKGFKSSDFNDDALARTLDKIYAAGAKKVFCHAALKALLKEELPLDILHADTTARLVYGDYPAEKGLNITYGYNKERRRDLKQFKLGLLTNALGFPLSGEILDGNLDDKSWNRMLLNTLPEHFTPEKLKTLTYVADSAFVTDKNLLLAEKLKLKFISRLPATFDLVEELTLKAFSDDKWANLGQLAEGKDKAVYRLTEYPGQIHDQYYRFLVVHSSQLDKRKLKKLDNQVEREQKDLEKEITALQAKQFACRPDAEAALECFTKVHKGGLFKITGSVDLIEIPEKRLKKGRPPKDEQRTYHSCYSVTVTITLDQGCYDKMKEKLSCFVIITNHPDLSPEEILTEYRNQTVVENRFKFIKDPIFIGPLNIKRKDRLEALCYVALIALALYMVLQIRVRKALSNETEPILLAGKKKSFEPTAKKILDMFAAIKIIWLSDGRSIERQLPKRYREITRLLKMAGFDFDIFTSPP
ncbi:MAG: IS1634 family transposase [Bacillota bacterium]